MIWLLFLWQAKAGFSHELRERLIEVYADEARRYDDVDAEMLKQQVRSMALIRTLQVLGAYGLRGRFERKPHFLQSIPLALGNLRSLLDEGIGDYPYLNEMLPRLIEAGKGIGVGDDGFEGLTVRVSSFSFKKVFLRILPGMAEDMCLIAGPWIILDGMRSIGA